MSVYEQRLEDLMTLLQGHAIDPSQAVTTAWGLQDDRRAQRQARAQAAAEAQQGALDSLVQNVTAAAGTPTTLDDALRLTSAQGAFSQGDVQGGLSQLFLPQQTYPGYPAAPPQFPGNSGQSRIAPTLRPEDAQDIIDLAQSGQPSGAIVEGLKSIYGPETLARLMPDVQALLSKYGTTTYGSS